MDADGRIEAQRDADGGCDLALGRMAVDRSQPSLPAPRGLIHVEPSLGTVSAMPCRSAEGALEVDRACRVRSRRAKHQIAHGVHVVAPDAWARLHRRHHGPPRGSQEGRSATVAAAGAEAQALYTCVASGAADGPDGRMAVGASAGASSAVSADPCGSCRVPPQHDKDDCAGRAARAALLVSHGAQLVDQRDAAPGETSLQLDLEVGATIAAGDRAGMSSGRGPLARLPLWPVDLQALRALDRPANFLAAASLPRADTPKPFPRPGTPLECRAPISVLGGRPVTADAALALARRAHGMPRR